jgi:phage minor structural protein
MFELECDVPVDGYLYNELAISKILVAPPAKGKTPQAFRIYRISKPINGIATVNAEHISYQLSYIPVMPYTALSLGNALNKITDYVAESCPFTFSTNKVTSTPWTSPEVPTSARAILMGAEGSLLQQYKGEYRFDNWTVSLRNQLGSDNGVRVAYGKNLVDMLQEESIENTYTGICPYYKSDDYVLTLPEKVLHSANASNFPYQRTLPVDLSDKFEDAPTEQQLRDAGNAYMTANNIGVPKVCLEVSFVQLSDTQEYKDKMIESVNLGDTVHVDFEKLGVSTTAEVVHTVYDVLAERFDTITVGSQKSTFSGVVAGQQEEIDQVVSRTRKKIRIYDEYGALLLSIDPTTQTVKVNGQLDLGSGATMVGANGVSITTGGDITTQHGNANTRAAVVAKRTDTNVEVRLAVGSGGTNHGVYSGGLEKWMVYSDGTDIYCNGKHQPTRLDSAVQTTGTVTLSDAMKYSTLVFVGEAVTNGGRMSITVPTVYITTTATDFKFADETNNYIFSLTKSGDNVSCAYVSRTSTGRIMRVYGYK